MELPKDISVDEFINKIAELKISFLDLNRVRFVVNKLLDYGPPEGFLSRFLQCFDYIGKDEFKKDLESLKELVLAKEPSSYTLAVDDAESSNDWIFDLINIDQKPADNINMHSDDDYKKVHTFNKPQNFVVVDDWAITGIQIIDDIVKRLNSWSKMENKFSIFLMYASNYAIEQIKTNCPNANLYVVKPGRIKTADEFLTVNDIQFLDKVAEEIDIEERFVKGDTLNVGWWCIPDNVPHIFRFDSGSRLGLFNPGGFLKPYHKDSINTF